MISSLDRFRSHYGVGFPSAAYSLVAMSQIFKFMNPTDTEVVKMWDKHK